MRIVRPATITDAALLASNATESVAAWNSGTTYAVGAQVRADATHLIYESVQAGNLNHAVSDPAWWAEVGPTNKWAMFDQKVATITTGAAGLDVTVQPTGRIDSLALLNLDAASAQVIVSDGVTEVYNQTFSLSSDSGISDWHAYFYEPIVRKTDLIIVDIPLISSPEIQIILSAGGGPCSIGVFLTGQSKIIGQTSYGANVGIIDYSRKEADEFGSYSIVKRAFARRGSFRVTVAAAMVDEVYRVLSGYRATPILYIASEDYTSTALYGFYKDFNVEISYPTISICSLDLEGLT